MGLKDKAQPQGLAGVRLYKIMYGCIELSRIDGPYNAGLRALFKGFLQHRLFVPLTHDHYLDYIKQLVMAEFYKALRAFVVRHTQIKQHKVRQQAPRDPEKVGGGRCDEDVVFKPLQKISNALYALQVSVCKKDIFRDSCDGNTLR